MRDDSGKITYQEIRDRTHYTMKVYSNGHWVTQHFRPHTTQLLQMDEGPASEEWLYDQRGKYNGLRVHLHGTSLAIHSEDSTRLGADGMDLFTLERDQDARVTAIRDGKGSDVARFQFDAKGYLRNIITSAQTLELTPPAADGSVTETLKAADGKVVVSISAPGSISNVHSGSPCLDAVMSQLGLGDDWQKELALRGTDSSSVSMGVRPDGSPLLYVLRSGGNAWAFDASGKALLIDFAIPLAASSIRSDTALAIHEQSAMAPNHIIITADGRVGGCTNGSASGAIASFWIEPSRRAA